MSHYSNSLDLNFACISLSLNDKISHFILSCKSYDSFSKEKCKSYEPTLKGKASKMNNRLINRWYTI